MIDEGISGEDFEAALESAPRDLSELGELLMDVRRGYERSRRSFAAEANTTARYLGRVERGEVRPSEAWLRSWGRAMAMSETGLGRLLVAYRAVPGARSPSVITDYKKIPAYTRSSSYRVDVPLEWLEDNLAHYLAQGLIMDPDFQRAHVWTEAQQMAFVEHVLRGGRSGLEIYFNCPGWSAGYRATFVLVDGKQRIQACLRFLRGEIPVFGTRRPDFTGRMPMMVGLHFNVNDLSSRAEVLRWYLDLNAGGTPHTREELERVAALLREEMTLDGAPRGA